MLVIESHNFTFLFSFIRILVAISLLNTYMQARMSYVSGVHFLEKLSCGRIEIFPSVLVSIRTSVQNMEPKHQNMGPIFNAIW